MAVGERLKVTCNISRIRFKGEPQNPPLIRDQLPTEWIWDSNTRGYRHITDPPGIPNLSTSQFADTILDPQLPR